MNRYRKRGVLAASNAEFAGAVAKKVSETCLQNGKVEMADVALVTAVMQNQSPVDEMEVMLRHNLSVVYGMNMDRARRRNSSESYQELELNEKAVIRGTRTFLEGMKTLHQCRGPHTQETLIVQSTSLQTEHQGAANTARLESGVPSHPVLPPPAAGGTNEPCDDRPTVIAPPAVPARKRIFLQEPTDKEQPRGAERREKPVRVRIPDPERGPRG